jgi:hypothetical protein
MLAAGHQGALQVVRSQSEVDSKDTLEYPEIPVQLADTAGVPPSAPQADSGGVTITGTRVAWFPLTLSFVGPYATETDSNPNPFTDYRLTVVFTSPSGAKYRVPGFFDGNGQGVGAGDVWRVRFAPGEQGNWTWQAHFDKGSQIAIDTNLSNGTPTSFDGDSGNFTISPRDPNAGGFYKWGLLEYVGEHYLKFKNGRYWLKGGVDGPENFLGYRGFDNTWDQPGGVSTAGLGNGVHRFGPHVKHWNQGDPLFVSEDTGYDSKGIIGALNYLGRVGVNSIYFMPMNMGGDGRETVPFVGFNNNKWDKTHYDISKLGQWNVVMEHAQGRGILLHVVLAETENANEQWLDNGNLGLERKLFFRELIARFGHSLALKWNLSEENDFTIPKLRQFADYIRQLDVYDHPIAFHTHVLNGSPAYADYDAVLGDARFSMTSIQTNPQDAGFQVENWRKKSKSAGRRWVVDIDEIGPAGTGLSASNAVDLRRKTLYDVYFSGGQIEWYLGYHPLPQGGDMRLEDYSTREEMWLYMRNARLFMQKKIPFWNMEPMDQLLTGESGTNGGGEVFAQLGETYAVYYPNATNTGVLNLTGAAGSLTQRWFSPRLGIFVTGPKTIQAGGFHSVGPAPTEPALGVSIETGGLLVVEAESQPTTGQWVKETTWLGFTGQGYYRWNGYNKFTTPGVAALSYDFVVTTPGRFSLSIHNRHNHPDPGQENDCWVRIDGGAWVKMYSNQGLASVAAWNWHTLAEIGIPPHRPPSYVLSEGVHRIEVSPRSKNFMFDRLHLYADGVPNPLKFHPPSLKGQGSSEPDDDWVLLIEK